jgi:acyl-CoA synthetase (NDP forming)
MPSRQADFNTTREILQSAGIMVLGKTVGTSDDAISVAAEIGYPVVMKLVSPDVVHKTDVGAVLLDIHGPEDVRAAWDRLMESARKAHAKRIDGVLVQKQVRPGFELLVGARQDPVFGPLTMVGTGGKYVELFKDVFPGIGLLDASDVERMLSETKAGRVVEGFRGSPLDKKALIDLVVKVSRLMETRPEVVELDLNPVILYPESYALVDARLILGDPVQHLKASDIAWSRMASLAAIFDARSVAVFGASKPGTVGGIILQNCTRIKRLYPINPRRDSLLGLKCYKNLSDLPEVPELAVFAVSPQATIDGFRDFCERGGKGAVIVSDGFAESGRKDLEDELLHISNSHGVVYIGPNGLGVVDNYSGLNTMFLPKRRSAMKTEPGSLGIISQSGGIGMEFLEMLAADNLSVGKWVSCGNSSGITIPELLAHLGEDPRIRVIALYLEGLSNGLQFVEVARRVTKKKPVIAIKGGMAGGAAATMSHTASLAGSFQAFRAACHQAGVYLIEELTEDPKILINALSILMTQKPARGNRVAVVSAGGGAAVVLADQVTEQGMQLADYAEETKTALANLLSAKMKHASGAEKERMARRVVSNPLDLFGDADDERFIEALRILNVDPNTDLILAALYLQVPYLTEYLSERLVELKPELIKPLILTPRGYSHTMFDHREYLTQSGFPTYTVPLLKPLAMVLDIWSRYRIDFSSPC